MASSQESLRFNDRAGWRAWLRRNHRRAAGIWLVIAKKKAAGLHYEEAVEEAVCFGWVDSTLNRLDDDSYKLWFSCRKPGSDWAESNKKRVENLIARGKMCQAGLAAVAQAKEDGSWDRLVAIDNLELPPELEAALAQNQKARTTFEALPPSQKKQYIYWIAQAKRDETRARRVEETLKMLAGSKNSRG